MLRAHRQNTMPSAIMTDEAERTLFSPLERRLFRYTAVLMSGITLILLIFLVFWGFAIVINIFYNLLLPLLIAGILTLVLYPLVDWLQQHLHLRRGMTVVLLYVVFTGFMAGLLFIMVPTLVEQFTYFLDAAPEMLDRLERRFAAYFPGLSVILSDRLERGELDQMIPEVKSANFRYQLMSYVGLLAGLGFVPFYLFFALLSEGGLRSRGIELLSVFQAETRDRTLYFVDVFLGYLTAFFRGQLLIALIMGVLYAAGFSIVGLQLSIAIGLILGFLNIIPFVGTIVGLLVVVPMAYFQPDGGTSMIVLALLVLGIVQMIESFVLTPKIMADQTGLHPALVVMSVFFWGIALGGLIGMILAVPLTAFFVTSWTQIKIGLQRGLRPGEK
jgi:predicted PurR-regulated permease PerM